MSHEQFVAELVGLLIAAVVFGWRARARECRQVELVRDNPR